jgi:hypothetical protein
MRASRQRGQLQPGHPSLGACLERGHRRGVQLQSHHVVEEALRLVGREPEVRGPHLYQLATGAKPGQRERRVGPSGHGQRDLGRQVVHEEGHCLVDGSRVDDVVVVQRHHHRTGEDVEIVDEADQGRFHRQVSVGLQLGEGVDTSLGFGGLYSGDEVGEEAPGVGVSRVERQPRHSALRHRGRRQPLGQEGGLAEPRRCRDQDQARSSPAVHAQPFGEAEALHHSTTGHWPVQFGAQHGHPVSVGPPSVSEAVVSVSAHATGSAGFFDSLPSSIAAAACGGSTQRNAAQRCDNTESPRWWSYSRQASRTTAISRTPKPRRCHVLTRRGQGGVWA